ncbi:hypothetical protein MTO96_043917 [Rhipicephalus appendiculatus]
MASRPLPPTPPKEHCFTFNVPEDTVSIDEVIDSIEETVGDEGVLFLQHLGTSKFLVATRTADPATSLLVNEGFNIREQKVSVDAVGPPIVHVNVYRLPPYVSNNSLVAALQPYGKVRDLQYTTVQKRQTTYSGTRVVKMEMTRPAPQFCYCTRTSCHALIPRNASSVCSMQWRGPHGCDVYQALLPEVRRIWPRHGDVHCYVQEVWRGSLCERMLPKKVLCCSYAEHGGLSGRFSVTERSFGRALVYSRCDTQASSTKAHEESCATHSSRQRGQRLRKRATLPRREARNLELRV